MSGSGRRVSKSVGATNAPEFRDRPVKNESEAPASRDVRVSRRQVVGDDRKEQGG